MTKIDTAKEILALRKKLFGRKANDDRGLNPKNVVRILRKVRERLAKANADGVDLNVLPPDSKIRRATEAAWENWVNPPTPQRGRAGRKAQTMKRIATKLTKQEQAIELLRQGLSATEVGSRIGRNERTVRRYKRGL